jgi:AbrB family looped-hinge helix DNA binding protein
MGLVKLSKEGQVSIPKEVLERLGLEDDVYLTLETTDDGAIILRSAIEIYSDERIAEFLKEDEMPPELAEKLEAVLAAAKASRHK